MGLCLYRPIIANEFTTEERGKPNSFNHRIYLRSEFGLVSPFHDVPLYTTVDKDHVHMVVEMPRWTNAKMEVNTRELLNPIMQDAPRGKLRYVANLFPYHGILWNYGLLPQTWANPHVSDDITNCKGDNDPLDAIEIGHRVANRGEVVKVNVLGAIALIDQGETDWKIICIDINDKNARKITDISEVEKYFPGLLEHTIRWFRLYKLPDGKPENQFAFEGKPKGRPLAMSIIADQHRDWSDLVRKRLARTICCTNTTVRRSPFKIGFNDAENILNRHATLTAARGLPGAVDKIFFP